jgi:protein required for attachment to host cells
MGASEFPLARRRTTWVVVANGKRMRVYESHIIRSVVSLGGTSKHVYQFERPQWALSPLPAVDMQAESLGAYDIEHDDRGSRKGYSAAERHTVASHIDIRDEIKENFAQSIAWRLREAQKQSGFDELIVVAPHRMLGELKKSFGQALGRSVTAEIPKDLTRADRRELLDCVREVLPLPEATPTTPV